MASILTSTARVKRAIGIPSAVTDQDTALDDVVNAVDASLAGWLGLPALTSASYTDRYTFRRGDITRFALRYTPVVSVTSVTDDGVLLVSGTDYALEDGTTGYLTLLDKSKRSAFTYGPQKVVVVYTAGHSASAPDEGLKRLATALCAQQYHQDRRAGIASERVGDHTWTASVDALPPTLRHEVSRWIRAMPRSLVIG